MENSKKCLGITLATSSVITYILYAICILFTITCLAIFAILAYLSGFSVLAARTDQGRNPTAKCDREFLTVCTEIVSYNNTDIKSYYMTLYKYPDTVIPMDEPEDNPPKLGEERVLYMNCIYGCVSHNLRYEEDHIRSQGTDDSNRYFYPKDKYHWDPPTADEDCVASIVWVVLGFTIFLILYCFLTIIISVFILFWSLLIPGVATIGFSMLLGFIGLIDDDTFDNW